MAWYSILDPAYLELSPDFPGQAGTLTAGRWESSPVETEIPGVVQGQASAITIPSLFETVYPTMIRVTWESDWILRDGWNRDQMFFGPQGIFANGTDESGGTTPSNYVKQQLEPVVDPMHGGYFVSGSGGSGGPGTYVVALNTELYDPLLIRLIGIGFFTWHNQFLITALEIDVPPGEPAVLSEFWTNFVKTKEVPT